MRAIRMSIMFKRQKKRKNIHQSNKKVRHKNGKNRKKK